MEGARCIGAMILTTYFSHRSLFIKKFDKKCLTFATYSIKNYFSLLT